MTDLIVLIVLLIPLAWSGAVAGLRRLSGNPVPDDAAEKYQLLIMVTPVLLGVLWIALSRLMPVALPLPLPSLVDGGPIVATPHAAAATRHVKAAIDLGPWVLNAALLAWIAGALGRFVPLAAALLRLRHIAGRAGRSEIDGVFVRLTEAALPPLALGRATILLPAGLAAQMAPEELRLIIRHEQAHLRRRDPLFFAVLGLLDAALWFNPFLRRQTRRCRLAAELACDAAASGNNPVERETYARVLIRALKHTAGNVRSHAPAAISNVKSGDYHMRLNEIMHADPAARKPKRRWLYLGLAAAVVPVAMVQFAWAQETVPATPSPHAATSVFAAPVDGPISLGFGPRANPVNGEMAFHQGVDFPVPVGTAVRTPADGKVSAVAKKWGYGEVVEIDHGNGLMTRFAHLDKPQVAVGDEVKAGQVIATSGGTGTTAGAGPHLHFEVWKNGKPIDPATMLPKAG